MIAVALLRGINLGGHHKVPMAELREMLSGLGLRDVRTFIASGNAIFRCERAQLKGLDDRLENALEQRYGFRPKVVLRTADQLRSIAAANPYAGQGGIDGSKLLVAFIKGDKGASYVYCPDGVAAARLPDDPRATARNWNTVVKLIEMAEQLRSLPAL